MNSDINFKIADTMKFITEFLLEKNRKYGNSALAPTRIFSKASPDEQLRVRIDDKISRISSQQLDEDEDVILDLIGYLVLYYIFKFNREVEKHVTVEKPEQLSLFQS